MPSVVNSRPARSSVSMMCGTDFQMFSPPNSGKSGAQPLPCTGFRMSSYFMPWATQLLKSSRP